MLTKDMMIEYFQKGYKPKDKFSYGIEWEQFSYDKSTGKPLPYYGDVSVLALLQKFMNDYGWQPYYEKDVIIALKRKLANGSYQNISLEPGGQIELSGGLQHTVQEVRDEVDQYYNELTTAGDALGIGFKALGFTPDWTREDFHLMPKQRYKIMTEYMPKRGSMGLDMMFRTCTVQVNMDYSSEADMVNKMRVGIALQPLVTAIFANSKIKESVDTGFASFRSNVWTDTDPDRTGMLSFVFDKDFGFERYMNYMLNVPMYFVRRDGGYIDCAGLDFKDFMAGKLAPLMGEYPTITDWEDHLSTAFPEVRLKNFIEMRGADSVSKDKVPYLAEFWGKILYDDKNLQACLDYIDGWAVPKIEQMRNDVPKSGFDTIAPNGKSLKEVYEFIQGL